MKAARNPSAAFATALESIDVFLSFSLVCIYSGQSGALLQFKRIWISLGQNNREEDINMVARELVAEGKRREEEEEEGEEEEEDYYLKGVRHLCESGISRVPRKYVLPPPDRPQIENDSRSDGDGWSLQLPVIDMAGLRSPADRRPALKSIERACREFGFFQVVNHRMDGGTMGRAVEVGKRFFDLPQEQRSRYMTSDVRAAVRYGTSFNQIKDSVFCWRDFLKLNCHPLQHALPFWPCSPLDLRAEMVSYAKQAKALFMEIMAAVLETLGIDGGGNGGLLEELDDGSHLLIVNCYPACPEPDVTLGMPPHSDYGLLTLLLQEDGVRGLQVHHRDRWLSVDPLPGSLIVTVGDHLEIFSNGRYKSVLHRAVVNSARSRTSMVSLHSFPLASVVRPAAALVDGERSARRYQDTDFAAFLDYLSSHEPKRKSFLQSRMLTTDA